MGTWNNERDGDSLLACLLGEECVLNSEEEEEEEEEKPLERIRKGDIAATTIEDRGGNQNSRGEEMEGSDFTTKSV